MPFTRVRVEYDRLLWGRELPNSWAKVGPPQSPLRAIILGKSARWGIRVIWHHAEASSTHLDSPPAFALTAQKLFAVGLLVFWSYLQLNCNFSSVGTIYRATKRRNIPHNQSHPLSLSHTPHRRHGPAERDSPDGGLCLVAWRRPSCRYRNPIRRCRRRLLGRDQARAMGPQSRQR